MTTSEDNMEKMNDGGSAFPISLRDLFALSAVIGHISPGVVSSAHSEWVARIAYEIADAMLKERAK